MNVLRTGKTLLLGALLLLTGCSRSDAVAKGVEGINGAWSPDGRRIAFQRENADRRFEIGVLDLSSGAIEWVVRGVTGTAAYPVWAPDGSLVYAYTPMTNTAYVAYRTKSDEGLNLYLRRDGVTRRLTHGRWQDFTPSFGPDGALYYASTEHGAAPKYERNGHAEILRLDLSGKADAACVVGAAQTVAGGVTSPAVSPDGRFIVWASREDFFGAWHLVGAPVGDISRMRPMTDYAVTASSPCWAPDGRHLFYQGFREGDPGWGVWVQDIATGAAKRICDGEHPAVSPDGKMLLYDDGKRLHVRRLTDETYDFAGCRTETDPWEREGTLHVTADFVAPDAKKTAKVANIGTLAATFVRGRVFARNYFKYDSPVSCQIPSDSVVVGSEGRMLRVSAVQDAEGAVWVFVNGGGGRFRIPIDPTMEISSAAKGVASDGATLVSSGAGWPADVRKPLSRKEMAE